MADPKQSETNKKGQDPSTDKIVEDTLDSFETVSPPSGDTSPNGKNQVPEDAKDKPKEPVFRVGPAPVGSDTNPTQDIKQKFVSSLNKACQDPVFNAIFTNIMGAIKQDSKEDTTKRGRGGGRGKKRKTEIPCCDDTPDTPKLIKEVEKKSDTIPEQQSNPWAGAQAQKSSTCQISQEQKSSTYQVSQTMTLDDLIIQNIKRLFAIIRIKSPSSLFEALETFVISLVPNLSQETKDILAKYSDLYIELFDTILTVGKEYKETKNLNWLAIIKFIDKLRKEFPNIFELGSKEPEGTDTFDASTVIPIIMREYQQSQIHSNVVPQITFAPVVIINRPSIANGGSTVHSNVTTCVPK
jgi:hypothetical protein